MKTMYHNKRKFLFAPLIIILIPLFAWVTMLLWNALLPGIFNLPLINFWQAAGLLILARLFFGFGHHRSWNGHRPYMNSEIRNKIKNMSSEEKKEFFRKMHYNRHKGGEEYYKGKEQKIEEKSGE